MKRLVWILVLLVAVGWLERGRFSSPRPECPWAEPTSTQQLTADGTAASSDALSVDDAALLKKLTDQASELIAAGKTVDTEVLIKQLEYDKCELKLAEPAEQAHDAAELYKTLKDSVVVVAGLYKCPRCDNWHAAPASGFVISADGAIVTSHHVINESDKKTYVVMTADGHVHPVTRVMASNKANDVAILKIDAPGLKPLPLAPSAPIGTPVQVISHPAARFFCLSSGVVSRYTRVKMGAESVDALQITADFARGSSGAPVLNAQGQVVGVVRSTESIYYSVESGQQKNLQMVFKVCTPAKSLRQLIGS